MLMYAETVCLLTQLSTLHSAEHACAHIRVQGGGRQCGAHLSSLEIKHGIEQRFSECAESSSTYARASSDRAA